VKSWHRSIEEKYVFWNRGMAAKHLLERGLDDTLRYPGISSNLF
jgi:hypothetical protein